MAVAARDGAGRHGARLAGALHRLASYPLFYIGLVSFGLGSLLWSIPASLLFRVMPRSRGARVGQFAIMAGFRAFLSVMQALDIFRCDLSALDALRAEGGLVITPNHPALLDAVLVISRLPRVVCITKASLWDNWFLGGGVRLAGYIRNDVPLKLVRRGMLELRAGHQLLIFPEGTRTVEPPVNVFKGGFLLMARKAGVPIQTVFIEGNSGYLGKGWPLFRKPELPLVYRARLGRRFDVPADVQAFAVELEAYFRAELATDPRSAPAIAARQDA
jgi:1-acyl-sn-glycerol-3-phosphate acyltransferase